MEYVTDLVETTFDQSFKWKVNNLDAASPKKDYIVRSKEINFFEANATWYLKLSQFVYNSGEKFLGSTFFLRDNGKDENARYKFTITMKDGTLLESQFISKNKTSKSSLLEYQMSQFIPIDKDCNSIEIEPRVILETLTFRSEVADIPVPTPQVEEIAGDDGESEYDTLIDSIPLVVPEIEVTKEQNSTEKSVDDEKQTEKSLTVTSSSESKSSEDSDSDSDSDDETYDLAVEDDKLKPEYKMSNMELTKRIRKIYLVKMKQIADTSSRLLVTAARNNFVELLSESCQSFAAQMSQTNFTEIWKIAVELDIKELKKAVVDYVVQNRERLTYDSRMSSDLMLEVVRAIG